jgi:hypothetical protein
MVVMESIRAAVRAKAKPRPKDRGCDVWVVMGVIVQDIFGLSGNVTINLICLWFSHQKLSHPKKVGLSPPMWWDFSIQRRWDFPTQRRWDLIKLSDTFQISTFNLLEDDR